MDQPVRARVTTLPPATASVGLGFMILIGFTLGCVWLLLPLLCRDW